MSSLITQPTPHPAPPNRASAITTCPSFLGRCQVAEGADQLSEGRWPPLWQAQGRPSSWSRTRARSFTGYSRVCTWYEWMVPSRQTYFFVFVVHTMSAMAGAMQFSRGKTSVVMPVSVFTAVLTATSGPPGGAARCGAVRSEAVVDHNDRDA
jgi:hypothetical protein